MEQFNQDELKMIFHVFGNTIGGSTIANDIFDKVRFELYPEEMFHPISPDLKISKGWLVLSNEDIVDL